MLNKEWIRRVTATWLALVVILCAGLAEAARVEWKTKTLKESEGHSWTVEVAIYLDRAPDVATLPMRFSFTPVVYYERSLLDGKEGPQLRQVPLVGKPPIVEGVDVGFMDPGNGKIEKRTKFSFKLKRGNGYEAGEYDVKIMDSRSNTTIGNVVRIVFAGENEVIDRRAMVFSGEKKKEKKAEGGGADAGAAPMQTTSTPEDDPDYWKKGSSSSTEDAEQNEEVDKKRGCGCRIGQDDDASSALAIVLGLGVLGAAYFRRRADNA